MVKPAPVVLVLLSLLVVLLVGGGARSGLATESEDAARAAAGNVPEVAALLAANPEARLVGGAGDDGGWAFEILVEDAELGFVVLTADLQLVEVGVADAESEFDEGEEDTEAGEAVPSLLDELVPRPEGAAFLWATLAIVLSIVWPRTGWTGRLIAIAIVVWGVVWLVFWRYVDQSQAVLWLTSLGVMVTVVWALMRGDLPGFAARGSRGVMGVGLIVVLVWLAWLALAGPIVEDAAIWGATGGRYLVDNLQFPYGALGEGATYGPVQYLLHAPLTILWPPGEIGADPFTAARVVAVAATVALGLGVVAALGRRARGAAGGAVAVLLLPWFVSVVDVANVSQLVPIAFTVWAFVLVGIGRNRDAVIGGVLLGLGAGTMFVPAFAAPALLVAAGRRWGLALGGLAATGFVIFALLALTGTDLGTFWNNTVRFQETAYAAEGGLSVWGRFGLEEWRWVGKALHAGLLVLALAGLFRYRTQSAAFLAAGVSIGGSLLWKGHIGPWGYLTWFVPLIVIGALLADKQNTRAQAATRGRDVKGARAKS